MNLSNSLNKKAYFFISNIFFILILLVTTSLNAQKKEKWKLVWKEEFNYTGLPNPKKWSYEVGHIRNNEQQYYTNARKENVWISKEELTNTGRKKSFPNE